MGSDRRSLFARGMALLAQPLPSLDVVGDQGARRTAVAMLPEEQLHHIRIVPACRLARSRRLCRYGKISITSPARCRACILRQKSGVSRSPCVFKKTSRTLP